MKYVVIGDVHLSDKPPSIRTDTYKDDILAKLRWVVEQAAGIDAQAIIQAGDLFHIKTPSRTSHELVLETAETLTAGHDLPVLVVPGNHDLMNDRLESLGGQPLGSLAMHPQIDLFMGRHKRAPGVFAVPYLTDNLTKVKQWKQSEYEGEPLIVTHASLFPPDQHPPYDHIEAEEWAAIWPEAWATYYGHIHDPHGTYDVSGHTFINNGAISRGSLHESTLKRAPRVTVIDVESRALDVLDVPHKPAREVFRLAEKEKLDDRKTDLEQFLTAVGTTTLTGLSLEEVAARAREADLDELAVKMVLECCEQAAS